mgnify:CR=1 FL=1
MKKKFIILFFCGFFLAAFQIHKTSMFKEPLNWPKANYDFLKNPLSTQKIELGRTLFYEPMLSRNNTISCASCHSQYTAFTHVDHDLSHGIDDRIGTRNSPALMNLAWHKVFMWDGAVNHLDVQALAPISHPNEMDEKLENVIVKLQKTKIEWKKDKSMTIVVCSKGYPGNYKKNKIIKYDYCNQFHFDLFNTYWFSFWPSNS